MNTDQWRAGIAHPTKVILLFFLAAVGTSASPSTSAFASDGLEETLRNRVFLMLEIAKKEAYPNEMIPLKVRLFVKDLSLKEVQQPRLSHEGFSMQEFENPLEKKETVNGVTFDVLEFQTTLFGTKTGKWTLGPAELQCTLLAREGRSPSSDDYFGAYETRSLNLRSEETLLTVKPFPKKGRPADFRGAVGNFDLAVEVLPEEAEAGDPVLLRMSVQGRGNFDTVTSPGIVVEGDFKVYEPHAIQKKNQKIYEQVLRPLKDTARAISMVSFSFYDPEKKAYRTIRKGPIPIKVAPPHREEIQKNASMSLLSGEPGREIATVKGSPGRLKRKGVYLYKERGFLLLQLLPLLLWIPFFLFHRHQEKMRTDARYAGQRRASRRAEKGLREMNRLFTEAGSVEFYDSVYGMLKGYLGDRFQIPSGDMTAERVDEVLMAEGVNEEVRETLKEILERCDLVRYGASESGEAERAKTLELIKGMLHHLERQRL